MHISYPGTRLHQALLERVVRHYQDDSRVLAVGLFGSLARGNWDEYSDLDLDIIIEEGVLIHITEELHSLCAAFHPLGERALIVVPNGDEEGDIVLQSLAELSVRYHTLATTSPNIVDSLQILAGKIDLDTVKMMGMANRPVRHSPNNHDLDRVLRWAVEVNIRVRRHHFWQAAQLLQRMRDTLVEIFAFSRGYPRAFQAFEAEADERIKADLGQTLPQHHLESIQAALAAMMGILENDLDELSAGQLHLDDTQRELMASVREQMRRL